MSTPITVVIGTFAAPAYIHLHLESWKRNYPSVSLCVHDDHSSKKAELEALCKRNNVPFASTEQRLKATCGDVAAFAYGLDMAVQNGSEYLVKFSRRFIPLFNWTQDFLDLATISGGHTFSTTCAHWNFGIRTEFFGMRVEAWKNMTHRIREDATAGKFTFAEIHVHSWVKQVDATWHNPVKDAYNRLHPKAKGAEGYTNWPLVPPDKTRKGEKHLWHEPDQDVDYARIARIYGLPYTSVDFTDPNCGEGNKR